MFASVEVIKEKFVHFLLRYLVVLQLCVCQEVAPAYLGFFWWIGLLFLQSIDESAEVRLRDFIVELGQFETVLLVFLQLLCLFRDKISLFFVKLTWIDFFRTV